MTETLYGKMGLGPESNAVCVYSFKLDKQKIVDHWANIANQIKEEHPDWEGGEGGIPAFIEGNVGQNMLAIYDRINEVIWSSWPKLENQCPDKTKMPDFNGIVEKINGPGTLALCSLECTCLGGVVFVVNFLTSRQ